MTRLGFKDITLKPSNSPVRGRCQRLRDQIKHQDNDDDVYLTLTGLFIESLFQMDKTINERFYLEKTAGGSDHDHKC